VTVSDAAPDGAAAAACFFSVFFAAHA